MRISTKKTLRGDQKTDKERIAELMAKVEQLERDVSGVNTRVGKLEKPIK